jgi:hypothetical protein
MISREDIKRLRNQKNATHKDTPIDRYNEPMYQKNASHRNTHHTRQGGRTDHSTSSHGLVPSSTDRVMGVLRDVCVVIWGYSGILWSNIVREVKSIRDTLWR